MSMAPHQDILFVGWLWNHVALLDHESSVTSVRGAEGVSLELKVWSVAGCVSHHSGCDCCHWSACLPRHVPPHHCPASI